MMSDLFNSYTPYDHKVQVFSFAGKKLWDYFIYHGK